MRKIVMLILLVPLGSLFGQEQSNIQSKYPNYVGDIEFNKETDREDFELCAEGHVFQYFNNTGGLEYEGEKQAIEKAFAEKYKSDIIQNETGSVRIRFIVNCKGETDRFRLIPMDENYVEKVFPESITKQLMNITKKLNGWKRKKYNDKEIDYYQYLIFKIEDGQLKEILP